MGITWTDLGEVFIGAVIGVPVAMLIFWAFEKAMAYFSEKRSRKIFLLSVAAVLVSATAAFAAPELVSPTVQDESSVLQDSQPTRSGDGEWVRDESFYPEAMTIDELDAIANAKIDEIVDKRIESTIWKGEERARFYLFPTPSDPGILEQVQSMIFEEGNFWNKLQDFRFQ